MHSEFLLESLKRRRTLEYNVNNGVEDVMKWIELLQERVRDRLIKHGDELSVCIKVENYLTDYHLLKGDSLSRRCWFSVL
jgi:hypothetical protein